MDRTRGKVDFPESLTDGAIREVWEETGLKVKDLEYKGLDEREAMNYPMQSWFKRRFPLFFEEGTFEIYEVWDDERQITLKESVKKL